MRMLNSQIKAQKVPQHQQRNLEKRKLFKPYLYPAIEKVFEQRLFGLFDNRCFRCHRRERLVPIAGKIKVLCFDHHVPMAAGGKLEPGNTVVLCRNCNQQKLDADPFIFYTTEQLNRVAPLLSAQSSLMRFQFDWDAWDADRLAYLLSLNVEKRIAYDLIHNPYHPDFIGLPERSRDIIISYGFDET